MIRAATLAMTLFCSAAVNAQEDPFGFMPDGGRGSFELVFADAAERAWALDQVKTVGEWQDVIAARTPELGQAARETLAAYLSVIAPLAGGPSVTLPLDGRDIALAQCMSCHSLFTGYLMQRRDRTAWLSTFASPFHQVIELTPDEREIFADYSAINMPMRPEEVPPALRY
ncbi:hypothetical protein [Roseicyclus marinus]|uniref:Cytochrome c n=1 Tax=Roseicyclus marinus TaxID=2161673 RepID=A0AA48KJT8_9RHOB|nr:hypothetical protein MACH21_26810 [Roseicyclus marinus]